MVPIVPIQRGTHPNSTIVNVAPIRFRPIMLTSITTFLGVAPLVFERSVQAQFLIPMAAALGFGILFATGILMMLVPAFTAIVLNILAWGGKTRVAPRKEPSVTEAVASPAGD